MNTNEVIKTVSEVLGCTAGEIRSSLRWRHLVAARKIIAVLLHDYPPRQAGMIINRNRATVHFYRRTFRDNLEYDRYLKEMYEAVLSEI